MNKLLIIEFNLLSRKCKIGILIVFSRQEVIGLAVTYQIMKKHVH